MKFGIICLGLFASAQVSAQAFPGSFAAERHFYSINTNCEESGIPADVKLRLREEAYLEARELSRSSNCKGMINERRDSNHFCGVVAVDGLNNQVSNHVLRERVTGLCIPR